MRRGSRANPPDVAAPDGGLAGAYSRHWLRASVQIGYGAGAPDPPQGEGALIPSIRGMGAGPCPPGVRRFLPVQLPELGLSRAVLPRRLDDSHKPNGQRFDGSSSGRAQAITASRSFIGTVPALTPSAPGA
jgi:hypothetical protein